MQRKKLRSADITCPWIILLTILVYLPNIFAQDSAPEIVDQPVGGQIELEGASKVLICNAIGSPAPIFKWTHNDTLLNMNFTTSTGTLRLINISKTDSGQYRCLASNNFGAELSQAADVRIAALRPFLPTAPETVTVEQGRAVILPLPAIPDTLTLEFSWEQNGQSLTNDIYHYKMLNNSLVVLSVDLNSNNKSYRAKAVQYSSNFQSTSSEYVLQIRDSTNRTSIAPMVIVPPVNTFAKMGDEKVELECVINARPLSQLTITWYRDNGTLTAIDYNNAKYVLTNYNRRFVIRFVAETDSGKYRCEGTLPSLGNASASATLFVQTSPVITNGLQAKIIDRDFGQSVTLPCQAQGTPPPTVTWYINGNPVSPTSNLRLMIYANGTLTVKNLDLPDAGKYQCFVRNNAGEKNYAVWLRVNSAPPQITKAPENLTVVEQMDARFFCQVTGAPQPQIIWSKVTGAGVQAIAVGGRFQIFADFLLITNVVKDDSGVYQCNATNIQGTLSVEAQLTVIIKTQIVRPPQNVTAILSTQVRFECGIIRDNNTLPVWEWFFYKSPDYIENQLTSSGRYHIIDGLLTIVGVSAQDIGKYKCHVISAGGNDSRTAYLNVIELPRPPLITSVTLNSNINNSVIVNWTKAFDGNSPILKYIITYRQENTNGNNDGVPWQVFPEIIPPSAASYVVTSLQPSRYYRFRISAVNSVGEGNASQPMPVVPIKMPTQPPSSAPRNFFCRQGSEQAIETTWDPPEESTWNGDLLGYVLRYKVANLPDETLQTERVVGFDKRSYIIQYLVYYKQYAISIAAYNEQGIGVFSNPFYVWTREGRPTAPPSQVKANSTNSTTVWVRWMPPYPGEINGINLGYTINMKQNSTLVRSLFVPSDPYNLEGEQETYIYSLQKFTWYNISIACGTSAGPGPFTAPVSIQTQEDVPGPVTNLFFDNIRDQSLLVRWSPPREINGILQGYVLLYEKRSQPSTRQQVDLQPDLTSFTIQNLSPVTNYTIYVAAVTSKGRGQLVSADIQSGVPPELPSPPYNLGISNIAATSVLLQFFPGFDGKTSITLWIVQAKQAGQDTFLEIFSIYAPQAREIWVQNLKPYRKYQLRIVAENIVGRSGPSDPSREFETLQAPPSSAPGNVTVRALNATSLRVSWTSISNENWNGAPRGYKIEYRIWSLEPEDAGIVTVQQPSWNLINLENGTNVDSYILQGLQEWMDYQIRMISYNDVGSSPYSATIVARTLESTPSASPSNLQAKTVSSTQILVTWGSVPRLDQNGLILGYKILYQPQGSAGSSMSEIVPGKNTSSVTLKNLRKFVMYDIQILAYTRMGDGIVSTKFPARTDEDVPGPPIIIYFPEVTFTSAVVVWSPPKEPNGIITAYKVSYYKQGESISSTPVELPPNVREYEVDGLERESYYNFTVTASTRLGWGESASVPVLTMENRGAPEQPSQPTVGNLQIYARNITIAWSPGSDNYSPIRNYTIQYKMRTEVSWSTVPNSIPPSVHSYTVTGLKPNSWYQFQVAATNDIGISNYSLPSPDVLTRPDKPDGAPVNVRLVALTRTSIQVSWEQPPEETWNGLLLSYIVQYRQVEQQDFQEEIVQFEKDTIETIRLNNLVIGKRYEVRVLAVNAIGRGPPSTFAEIYVGEAAPTAPPDNVRASNRSSSSIEVTWMEPPTETQNGGLSGYKVLYFKNSSGPTSELQRITSDVRLLIEGLDVYSKYVVSVQAYNLAGDGPRSQPIMVSTSEGVPSAPQQLQFTNITMRQLTVSFKPPLIPNGRITLYEMEYSPTILDPFDPIPPKRVLRENETLVVVTGLNEETEYNFRVSANTSIGRGAAAEARIKTGPQPGSPSAPSKPSVSSVDSGNILVSWFDGEPGASPIYGYLIQNKREDEPEFSTLMQEVTRETNVIISLTNLNPMSKYQFRIIAMNNNGISKPSVPSDIFVTPSLARPLTSKAITTEWWFLVIVALAGLIVILVIISLLCLFTRRRNAGKEIKQSQSTTTVLSEPSEPEDGGFPTYELRQSRNNIPIRNGTVKNIYARPPPRPSPASVAYSDDDDDAMSTAKAPIPDSDSSVTDKPSDLDDSTEPSDESDAESDKVPASPPPPAFNSVYANSNNVRQSWRFQNTSNAYAYTDSEADSSHYAFSLNNGQMVVNNVAGARTPLTGFSSFV